MENLHQTIAKVGNSWSQNVAMALLDAYEPLQAEANKRYGSDIKAEKAIKYGSDARHRIDVYSPAAGASDRPVIVYFHGGGFVTGDNDLTPNVYTNVGNWFTQRGYITCLATYRLALQGGHYPDGAEDVTSALKWVQANIANYGGDASKVVVLGQSAGGIHLLTALFLGFLDNHPSPLLRGFVSLSAPFTIDVSNPKRNEVLADWFQDKNADQYNERFTPLALFRQWHEKSGGSKTLPFPVRFVVGELDMEEATEGTFLFVTEFQKRFGKLPLLEVLRGHNHVSYCFGLGIEEDPIYEEAGKRLLDYVEDILH